MDLLHDTETIEDLSALAWVHDELRRSLEAAHKAMRRYLKEAAAVADSDTDAVDPSVLRGARAQIHQGVGALELVGLPTAAQVLRASEAALQKLTGRPVKLDAASVDTLEQASFALLDYLARLLAGKPVSPLALFPQYRAVQELAGADRVHPADLWPIDWQWRDVPGDGSAPRAPDAALRSEVEAQTLTLMRQGGGAPARALSDLFASLAAGSPARQRHLATLWHIAAAFFEAQGQKLLGSDVYSKRVASRLLAQLRMSEQAGAEVAAASEVSQRLAQDLLFFCSQAASPGDGRKAPRLAAVRQAWNLARRAPVDYLATSLGRHDPAWIVQARKRVNAAKESWAAVAGGEMHRLSTLNEQFHLVGESLKKLYPSGDKLAGALAGTAAQTVSAAAVPAPALAMEVATAVLYLEASLEDADFDHPTQAERVQRLAERIDRVRGGAVPQPLDAWMEDLYRRVSDRQTMGSVVQELKGSLAEVEKSIDQYFREPSRRELLHPVPGQLNSMRGVFSVLGIEQASHAVVRMRDDVDMLAASTSPAPDAAATDRLASNLGALGFLIDMLNVQPAMAKSLFAFDARSGQLHAVAAGGSHRASGFGHLDAQASPVEPRLIEQAQSLALAAAHPEVPLVEVRHELERLSQEAMVADQPELAETMHQVKSAFDVASNDDERKAVRDELAQAMADFVHTSSEPAALDEYPATRPMPVLSASPTPAGQTGLEEDAEMREIFLEEAREVIDNANQALSSLAGASDDLGEMTTVRRAFHTLKGSSRMVGLTDFGEAGWACEQLYNSRLAEQQSADPGLIALTSDILAYLSDWTNAIAARRNGGHTHRDVQHAIEQFRQQGAHGGLALPGSVAPTRTVSASGMPALEQVSRPMSLDELMPELPSEGDLDLVPAAAAGAVLPLEQMLASEDGMSFELDLGEAAAMPTGGRDALQALALPEREADAPAPDLSSGLMSLEFEESMAAPPALEPAQLRGPMSFDEAPSVPEVAPVAPPVPEPVPEPEAFRQIGPLRVPIPLFNIYLNEADEQSRRLGTELAEWSHDVTQPVSDTAIALAHSLAGNSATVGFADLSALARSLEHALMRSQAIGAGDLAEAALFNDSADEIRRLLHQFAAGFLKSAPPELMARLADHERLAADRLLAASMRGDLPGDTASMALDEPAPATEAALPHAFEPAFEPDFTPAQAIEPEPVVAEVPLVPEPQPEPQPEPVAAVAAPTPVAEFLPTAEAVDTAPSLLLPLGQAEFHALSALAPLTPLAALTPRSDAGADDDDIDAVDAVDPELFPIFEEEAQELLPQLASRMRDWAARPSDPAGASACMRTLHTLKGGARLAGAMRLGELAHRLETAIERLSAHEHRNEADVEALFGRVDGIGAAFEALTQGGTAAMEPLAEPALADTRLSMPQAEAPALPEPATEPMPLEPAAETTAFVAPEAETFAPAPAPAPAAASQDPSSIDWRRFAPTSGAAPVAAAQDRSAQAAGSVRVRAPLLDRLVNHAGEVSIARSRIESEVVQLKGSLSDLTENLERLRSQLRDIELQAESQISSRMEAAKAVGESFDPLEMDRFTRFQELTRMMAESVNDVATVQRSLQRTLQSTEDDLAAQARLTRDMQDDLLRTRMVEFESLSDRLYRVARQAAKELQKQVRLDIVGGSIEVDRGVLERMSGAFEHLLRNCVAHGIELPAVRESQGKDAAGQITVSAGQEGNEVAVEFRDDGAGLDFARIRERGVAMGLLAPDANAGDAELANLIFTPGFSTAASVTELAGRGIGMDVVRSEVIALGGRIETASAPGQGTSFRLVLPLTTAVTQVVMVRAGAVTVALPATLIENVRRVPAAEVERAYASAQFEPEAGHPVAFFWLGALMQGSGRSAEAPGKNLSVIIVRSAAQRVALHVDEVVGNQEVVVKNLGPQLARLPGLAGVTLLASGAPALIYNPVALATLYGEGARIAMRQALTQQPEQPRAKVVETEKAPLVLVVDDSLTVRRVTQRLLVREGYRVVVAKDGLDALEKLADELPVVVLSDIEMPRMDGFDLVRNLRADPRLADLPVIMITSRIAQKHREHAAELGVDHYLGKPYSEDDLVGLVARYAASAAAMSAA
jgi:chemosensory pili system protein ChpA (sensor histidine kinase/response regulator)